jgi:[histone H3]-trimethyl-L-lysine4 demethylase
MHEPSAPRSRSGKPSRAALNTSSSSLASSMPTDLAPKPPAAFYSCLAIPVEGARPIHDNDPPQSRNPPPLFGEARRAPRKSKTDALAAMQIQAHSTEEQHEMLYEDNETLTYARGGPPIPVPAALDLSTVKTVTSRNLPKRTKPRPFGLSECPTFYPTTEEFKDPMGYIRSISDQAKDFGICKVVPPAGWKMPFVTDTEASSKVMHQLSVV